MVPSLRKANFQLFLFAFFKVPGLWFVRPKLIKLTEQEVIARIKLRRRTKNHLNSMYFGSLMVGADLAGGFLLFSKTQPLNRKISFAFKSCNAEFLKRAEGDVHFICRDGDIIDQMLAQSDQEKIRVNRTVRVEAVCSGVSDDVVATFEMGLSVKFVD